MTSQVSEQSPLWAFLNVNEARESDSPRQAPSCCSWIGACIRAPKEALTGCIWGNKPIESIDSQSLEEGEGPGGNPRSHSWIGSCLQGVSSCVRGAALTLKTCVYGEEKTESDPSTEAETPLGIRGRITQFGETLKGCCFKVKECWSNCKPQILFGMLLAVQAAGAYPMDLLAQNLLDIQQVSQVGGSGVANLSLKIPSSLVANAAITGSLYIAELVAMSIFLRVTKITGLVSDYEKIDKDPKSGIVEGTRLDRAKKLTPTYARLFALYALASAVITVPCAVKIAEICVSLGFGAASRVNDSPGVSASITTVAGLDVDHDAVRIYGALLFFGLRHCMASCLGLLDLWSNQGAVVTSAGVAHFIRNDRMSRPVEGNIAGTFEDV